MDSTECSTLKTQRQSDRLPGKKEGDPMSKTKPQMYRFNNISRAYIYDTEGFYEHSLMRDIRNTDAIHDIVRRLPTTENF